MDLGLNPAKTRQTVCGLNMYLANLQVMYIKVHNYHWNVVGCNFLDFHEELQEIYEFIAEEIDRVAERIKALGYMPVGNLENALRLATVKGAASMNYSAPMIARSMICDFSVVANQIRALASTAGENNDECTIAILSEGLCFYEKYMWFFRAYLTPTTGPCS